MRIACQLRESREKIGATQPSATGTEKTEGATAAGSKEEIMHAVAVTQQHQQDQDLESAAMSALDNLASKTDNPLHSGGAMNRDQ